MFATVVIAIHALGTGCGRPHRAKQAPLAPDVPGDVEFLHYLASAPVVSVDDGARAVLLLVGGSDQWPSSPDRWDQAHKRGMLRDEWGLQPQDALDVGTLAHMLQAVLRLPSGVNGRLARLAGVGERRYALKACVDVGLLPPSRTGQPVRGGELVSALQRAEELDGDAVRRGGS